MILRNSYKLYNNNSFEISSHLIRIEIISPNIMTSGYDDQRWNLDFGVPLIKIIKFLKCCPTKCFSHGVFLLDTVAASYQDPFMANIKVTTTT